jgi:hypothetical protein
VLAIAAVRLAAFVRGIKRAGAREAHDLHGA